MSGLGVSRAGNCAKFVIDDLRQHKSVASSGAALQPLPDIGGDAGVSDLAGRAGVKDKDFSHESDCDPTGGSLRCLAG